ncbi:MAG: fumarylacetoacetate hydrolase family protein [Kordiimonadaceae bacterium]|jgi:2,4-didehydro-3-deoxy-L-rhamnonate hydrolase|nr:fumarylacetoacetate hydrolase family protein [Kordiimonadaceae bacterium]MBT6031525.1 fumarylacetoacetate hydrolase family protein [Kordiimonadaceae bacterium]
MKLLRYGLLGQEKPGLMDDDGNIRDLSAHIDDVNGATVSEQSLAKLGGLNISELPVVDGDPRIGACVGNVGKFVCIGLNFADHAKEAGLAPPSEPVVFMKNTSAICGPNDDIVKPRGSTKLDWEVELALVIGKNVSYADEAEAADAIAGYCICNDVSEREFQLERSGQWDLGKGCDTFGPIGPWLVTKDEVADDNNLAMKLEVNGTTRQNGNTNTMIFNPAFIVSFLSQYMSLQPGDVISTGTPPGVGLGHKPPLYLKVGDTMSVTIDGLGVQNQTVISAT